MRPLLAKVLALFRRRQLDRDLDDEIAAHLELATADNIARGMSPVEARVAAVRRFGGTMQAKEAYRDRQGFPLLDSIRHDLRYALRTLRGSPGFTAVAIVTLALGIGATTAIYSVVDTILLQPLPFPDSDRLVRLVENVPSRVAGRPPLQRGVTYQDFLEWRTRSRTLQDTFVVSGLGARTVRTREGTTRLWGAMASPEAFTPLGARALLGRTLVAGDDTNPNVVVISFDVWRRVFHSDRAVVGTTLELQPAETMFSGSAAGGRVLTVVGVLPEGFEFPTGPLDFLAPVVLDSKQALPVAMIGRMRDGVSMTDAIDEANAIGSAVRPPRPANAPAMTVPRFEVQVLKDQITRRLRPALGVLLAAVAVVLLIVCANLASLLLARGTARRREIAVRYAIGASRGRVVRQVLTECLVLAIAGGALGALFAAAGITLVQRLASVEAPGIFRVVFGASILPRGNEVGVDLRMFGFAFGIAACTSIIFGILPALHLSRADGLQAMAPRGGEAGPGESRLRVGLVIGQVAMATVLLVGAGLLVLSFVKLSSVENGYDPSHVLVFQLVLPGDYAIGGKTETIEAVLTRLRASPNVTSAGFTRAGILLPEEIFVGTFVPEGRTLDEMRADPLKPRLRPVSHGYLTAIGARLLEGRELTASDTATAPPVVVISRSVARRLFGAGSAVGRVLNWHAGKAPGMFPVRVVGVVEDVRNEAPDRDANPDVFVDYRQLLELSRQWGDSPQRQDEMAIGFVSFAVRTRTDPASAVTTIGQSVRSVDPNAGVDAITPMDRLLASSIARPRFYAAVLGVFAGVAGVLAVIGIYGLLAYAVIRRTHEIGIRMALGARRAQVLGLVLRQGLTLTIAGIVLGLAGAAAATRILQGMLFGVTPLDVRTFIAVALVFGVAAAIASYVPARRATNVDPIVALRIE